MESLVEGTESESFQGHVNPKLKKLLRSRAQSKAGGLTRSKSMVESRAAVGLGSEKHMNGHRGK